MTSAAPPTDREGNGERPEPVATRASTRRLETATKAAALGSLVVAVAWESWLARAAWAYLPHAAAAAGLLGLAGGRLAALPVSAATLFLLYLAPLGLLAAMGRFGVELLVIWSAALTGLLVADPDRWRWAYPRAWQFPLVLWALAVAVAWPITALREADFTSLELLQRYNVPNTAIGGSPRMLIIWGLDTAIIHLLGLLWFNWLFARAGHLTDAAFRRWIVWPLAAGAVTGSLLTLYQGLFDLTYYSVGAWATLRRAAGPLLDANPSGMMAALWSAGLLALATRRGPGRPVAFAGTLVCWGAMWVSGSRTAFVTAVIALGVAGITALRRQGGRRRILIGGALTAAGAVVGVVLMSAAASESPVSRLSGELPADVSPAALGHFGREMWNRNGYGEVATMLIAERPATGVGIGLFNLEASAHSPRIYRWVPPDNAQNWWRHHVAELGLLGASGLLLWTGVFATFLWRTSGAGPLRVPAAALKGAVVGLALTSFVGMPAQSLALSMTFWVFAFWYARLAAPGPAPRTAIGATAWVLLVAFVATYAALLLVLARGADRPAMRAAVGGWRYTYGIYDPGTAAIEGETLRWTEQKGVAVVPNATPWMVLTVRARHPDIRERPVRARVVVNGRTVVETTLHTDAPLTRAVNTGAAERAILETRVDRTWRPADAPPPHPEAGLSLSWRFAAGPPPGLPAVTAPLRQ